MDDDGWSVASTASRLRRTLSRSLASNLNVKRSRSLSDVIDNMCDVDVGAISNGILAAAFWVSESNVDESLIAPIDD